MALDNEEKSVRMTIDPVSNAYIPVSLQPRHDAMAFGLEQARGIVQRRSSEAKTVDAKDLARRILADLNAAIAGARSE